MRGKRQVLIHHLHLLAAHFHQLRMQDVSEIIIRYEDALSRLTTVFPAPNSHYVPDVVQTLSLIKLFSDLQDT